MIFMMKNDGCIVKKGAADSQIKKIKKTDFIAFGNDSMLD
jgi:hypothetical protein